MDQIEFDRAHSLSAQSTGEEIPNSFIDKITLPVAKIPEEAKSDISLIVTNEKSDSFLIPKSNLNTDGEEESVDITYKIFLHARYKRILYTGCILGLLQRFSGIEMFLSYSYYFGFTDSKL